MGVGSGWRTTTDRTHGLDRFGAASAQKTNQSGAMSDFCMFAIVSSDQW